MIFEIHILREWLNFNALQEKYSVGFSTSNPGQAHCRRTVKT